MADSSGVYWVDILKAVKLKLASIDGLPPIRRRKRAIRLANVKEPANIVFVSAVSDDLVAGGSAFMGPTGQRSVTIRYTVKVTVSFQANTQYEEDPVEPLIWREKIRQLFDQPRLEGGLPGDPPSNEPILTDAPTVYDCNYTLGPVYDASGEDSTYDSTSIGLTFDSIEPANGPQLSNP